MAKCPDDIINTSHYILNEKNIEITKEFVENVLYRYGIDYNVNNMEYFKLATVHKSYIERSDDYWKKCRSKSMNKDLDPIKDPNSAIPLKHESNERIEFLGDAIIHSILTDYIYNRYDQDEGFMTKLRTKIEKGTTLAHFTEVIGLNKYILLSRYIEKNYGRKNNKNILEDAFEAFIGALVKDSNYDICNEFLVNLIEDEVDFAAILNTDDNYKDQLLKFCHQQVPRWKDPEYGETDVSGPDHCKVHTTFVRIKKKETDVGKVIAFGKGVSKKQGQQEAARQTLIYYGVIKDPDFDTDSETIECLTDEEEEIEEFFDD